MQKAMDGQMAAFRKKHDAGRRSLIRQTTSHFEAFSLEVNTIEQTVKEKKEKLRDIDKRIAALQEQTRGKLASLVNSMNGNKRELAQMKASVSEAYDARRDA